MTSSNGSTAAKVFEGRAQSEVCERGNMDKAPPQPVGGRPGSMSSASLHDAASDDHLPKPEHAVPGGSQNPKPLSALLLGTVALTSC